MVVIMIMLVTVLSMVMMVLMIVMMVLLMVLLMVVMVVVVRGRHEWHCACGGASCQAHGGAPDLSRDCVWRIHGVQTGWLPRRPPNL
jgi:hypothetical protein